MNPIGAVHTSSELNPIESCSHLSCCHIGLGVVVHYFVARGPKSEYCLDNASRCATSYYRLLIELICYSLSFAAFPRLVCQTDEEACHAMT